MYVCTVHTYSKVTRSVIEVSMLRWENGFNKAGPARPSRIKLEVLQSITLSVSL